MQHTLHTLKNGLRVVLAPMAESQTTTIIVMTGTGSRYESERENGLAHFLEHMFFKGTKKRSSAKAISEELDAVGAAYNAFTSQDRTAYWAKVSARYFDTAFCVISDIFLNSTLPAKEIAKERGAIIQEIDMYEDMPIRTVNDVFDALMFGRKHPLGRTILGPKENIRRFTRKDFTGYHARNYTPLNTVVCVAGSFNEKRALTKLTRIFGGLRPGNPPDYIPFSPAQTAPRVSIKEKKTDQTQLILGVPAYPYLHADEYALMVLTTILGGGMSSRLFIEVRERRGLAYSVHAWTEKYQDTGYLAIQAGVEHAKLEKATSTVVNELKKLKRVQVDTAELNKAKSYIKGTLALSRETSDDIAASAASSVIQFNRVRTVEEIWIGVDAVSAEDVRRVARDLFKTERLNLAIIGPHVDANALKKLLRI